VAAPARGYRGARLSTVFPDGTPIVLRLGAVMACEVEFFWLMQAARSVHAIQRVRKALGHETSTIPNTAAPEYHTRRQEWMRCQDAHQKTLCKVTNRKGDPKF
jgi:hypothetical protein